MQLDGDDLAVKINIAHPGGEHQLLELLLLVHARMAAKICKVYLRLFHVSASSSFVIKKKYTVFSGFVNPFARAGGTAR